MKIPRLLFTALLAGSASEALVAQTAALYPGTKANVSLTLTTTSEVGGFLIKDSALASNEEKGIVFFSPSDPLGYSPSASAPAHYYRTKQSRKSKDFTSSEGTETLTTESTTEEVAKLVSQKFTNVNFIQELINRELVPIPSAVGYNLVVVQPLDSLESESDRPLLFFIENGNSVFYVGRQSGEDNAIARDALVLGFSDGVEAYNYKARRVFSHRTENRIVEGQSTTVIVQDEEGVETVSDTFSGRSVANIAIFGSYLNEETGEYVSNGGPGFYASGELKYAGRYDAKGGLYLTTSASMSDSVGNYYGYDSQSENYLYGASAIGFRISSNKRIDDITRYLNALPEELADLKNEIIEGYSESSDF